MFWSFVLVCMGRGYVGSFCLCAVNQWLNLVESQARNGDVDCCSEVDGPIDVAANCSMNLPAEL
jgi:hypothetical protein